MSTKIQKIYNQNAKKYKQETQNFSFPEWMFDFFLSELAGQKILDIWCAYWREVLRLSQLGFEAYGLDISSWLLEEADINIRKYLQLWDMLDLSSHYRDNSFDGIISSASIVHMDHVDWLDVLQQAYRLLKQSGVLFLSLKVSRSNKTVEKESISTPWAHKPQNDQWKILVAKK